jgi:type II secretory pathway predicted ATPase ExeA
MYEAFFQFKKRPFLAMPVADDYYPASSIEAAHQSVVRAIDRATGPAAIFGPAGVGKSLLLSVLAKEFASRFETVQLAAGRLRSVRALLQNILFELKLPFRGLAEGELRLTLLDRLEPSERSPHGMLLLVDEAHVLPAKLLDELRMVTNLVRGGQMRVRLVLAGDVRLEERLANPRLASFQQRLAARCYLQSFTKEETLAYVSQQLSRAGGQPHNIADDSTLTMIHRLTDGVPRVINQLCDHALILAAVAHQRRLTASGVEEAWHDLQQLPVAPQANFTQPSQSSVVEFGALDELPATDRVTRIDAGRSSRDPLAQLDAIERQIADANREDFEPLSLQEAELELSFHSLPFNESFEEEEVVIDRYASLESRTMLHRPRVSSSEGRAIAALMGITAPARQQLGIVSDDDGLESHHADVSEEAFEDPFDPASDPVMPEFHPSVSTNVAAYGAANPELVVVDTVGDTQQPNLTPNEPPARAHRQEYRQLFARLRRGG